LGLKDLAYEIEKNNKGDFWTIDLSSESPIKLKEFNLLLNRESNIIRYLILKKE
jgi:ribosomal protein S6